MAKKLMALILGITMSFTSAASMDDEIKHLLAYVGQTQCQYDRNGTLHSGQEAVAHIQKKFDYFKDDIHTTEDFVKYSATKSKMSGKYYHILCPGKDKVRSQDWLLAELKRYRQTNAN